MKIHLDLDCYFVSAERTRYAFLKNKNVVVVKGSDKKIFSCENKKSAFFEHQSAFNSILQFPNHYNKDILNAWKDEFIDENNQIHGIVIAKSYEAKNYGIKTGTHLKQALLMCKNLHVIPSDHLFYQELSQSLRAYLQTQIPLLEQYSIDEFFGDLNGYIKNEDTHKFILHLQSEILKKFDLPITIGASRSKWIAKLITDKIKPFGTKVLFDEQVKAFTKDICIDDFAGIGKKISKKLFEYRIKTLGELQLAPSLLRSYGKVGEDLYKRICGIDDEAVDTTSKRRGIGISRNFKAVLQRDEIYRRASILARYLSFSIIKLNLNPTSFYFKIRFENGLKNSISTTQNRLFNERFLIDLSVKMVEKLDIYKHLKIHYIGINASNFCSYNKTFCILHHENDKKLKTLSLHVNALRDKYGIDIVKYANENSYDCINVLH